MTSGCTTCYTKVVGIAIIKLELAVMKEHYYKKVKKGLTNSGLITLGHT